MDYKIAWWNLENLFDVEGSPDRPQWLASRLKKELQGWNSVVLDKKISQLVKVIAAMNDGMGPDILAVCEIESKAVLEKLINAISLPSRDYGIVHADTNDKRGIDVAFIYDKNQFSVDEAHVFNQVIIKRNATRDILQATFFTNNGNEFTLLANHWPSRTGGVEASDPYRMMAGETLAYWHERIIDIKGETPIFALGDFNDEPFSASLEKYALSTRSLAKVKSKRSQNPYLYNLMWNLMDDEVGTHSYNGVWSFLDQLLVNRAGLEREGIYCTPGSVEIFEMPGMVKRRVPVRFGRPSKSGGINEDGYSDHMPVILSIKEYGV